MTISGLDTLFYTLAFVVPGFVMNFVYSSFFPQKKDDTQTAILKFIYFSSLHYAVWSWAFYIMIKTNYSQIHPIRTTFWWAFVILISPIVFGILAGKLVQKDTIRKLLHKIGMYPIHPVPTAWDYIFGKIRHDRWIVVTLIDGIRVGGIFGSCSFASSDPAERDIYIEEVYRINDDGPWEAHPRSQGILIKGDQIKHIEFKV